MPKFPDSTATRPMRTERPGQRLWYYVNWRKERQSELGDIVQAYADYAET